MQENFRLRGGLKFRYTRNHFESGLEKVGVHMIGIKNSILRIVLLFSSIGSTASGVEFIDHQQCLWD